MAIGDIPENVRFIVTGRTGRLESLQLPTEFTRVSITGFAPDETAAHVRTVWRDAPDDWIEDFHHFSNGNPRVQKYALDYAKAMPSGALNYLRPHGKVLEQVFREQIELARQKTGHQDDITVFCAGLAALPRPVPIADLSAVTELNEAQLRDFCADLAPGIKCVDGLISFADEDFEHFIREEAKTQIESIKNKIATHFLSHHRSDAYAASHIAAALFDAGRGREIINLVEREREPIAIRDPVLRRQAQLQRLRIAMKVCRETDNIVDAMLTLLIGAEALKTDAAIRDILTDNPDLAAHFASSKSNRMILCDPDEIQNHGPLLFHLMAADAQKRDAISVREGSRQVQAWMQRRSSEKQQHHLWQINARDIAAQTEAYLRIGGPKEALRNLLRWTPRSIGLRVASILSSKLIVSDTSSLLTRILVEAPIRRPWGLLFIVPLALAGNEVDLSEVESSLASLFRHRLISPEKMMGTWADDDALAEFLDLVLTACEIVIARGGDRSRVVPILELFANKDFRRHDKMHKFQIALIDYSLRAHALLERLEGRKATILGYLVAPPDLSTDIPSKKMEKPKQLNGQKKRELEEFIGPLIEVYDVCAQVLMGLISVQDIESALQSAIAVYKNEDYRYSTDYYAHEMRVRAALSVTRLLAVPSCDPSVIFQQVRSLLNTNSDPFGSKDTVVFSRLSLARSLREPILSIITQKAEALKKLKASAEDKTSALIRFARLLHPISKADAQSLFNEAIEVAGEVNIDAIHELALVAPIAERAVGVMTTTERRAVACDFAIVAEDIGVRLCGHDDLPWRKVAQTLATLDLCLALAATGRWEDSNITPRSAFLPAILETALQRQDLSAGQIVALSSLLDQLSADFMVYIAAEASGHRGGSNLKALNEMLAQDELLRFGHGLRRPVSEKLRSISGGLGFWLDKLVRATDFHDALRPSQSEEELSPSNSPSDLLDDIAWNAHRFVTAEDIQHVIASATESARAQNSFVSFSEISDRMRHVVSLGDRAAFLEALSQSKESLVSGHELGSAIVLAINEWSETPSVAQWCRERLIQVVVERLPDLSRWLRGGNSPLPDLIRKCTVSDDRICSVLLEGLERHVDAFSAANVYSLIGLTGQYCKPNDAKLIVIRYVKRLLARIPTEQRDRWDLNDIPNDPAEGTARLIYAFLGDIDVRSRWRAAHTVRRLARVGEITTINKLVELYGRTLEASFRNPDAPFYWLAARLWLLIAVDRIGNETPRALTGHTSWLFEIATNDNFPHLLIRSFAKSALMSLLANGTITLDAKKRASLKCANESSLRRKKIRDRKTVGLPRHTKSELKKRRFHFDPIHTLPYWYSRAMGVYADLGQEEFLDVAERWIVGHWGISGDIWRWDQEPRQPRFSNEPYSTMHSNGSLPVLERFHRYLEWHAMFCATGELLRTHALARADKDSYSSLEEWLKENGITDHPLWLSDLRGAKPLESGLWFAPQGDINIWVENCSDDDFTREVWTSNEEETIVVNAHHETTSSGFRLRARVKSALVSPNTASALLRALQSVEDSWDYVLPTSDSDFEIVTPPYKLIGWLREGHKDTGIDEHDPFRYGVKAIDCHVSKDITKILGLRFVFDNEGGWISTLDGKRAFSYESWGEIPDNEREDRFQHDKTVRSGGSRLRVDKESLQTLLKATGLDLIVEVEIERRNQGYGYWRYDEEKAKEERFDRVFLLRRDGSIEIAEGRSGSWAIPSK